MPPAEAALESVGDALASAQRELTEAGCDTPRLDAELLMAEVLRVDRGRLVMDRDRVLSADESARFGSLMSRRVAREPVAYILGRRDFRRGGYDFLGDFRVAHAAASRGLSANFRKRGMIAPA